MNSKIIHLTLKISTNCHTFDPAVKTENECDESQLGGQWDVFSLKGMHSSSVLKEQQGSTSLVVKTDHV